MRRKLIAGNWKMHKNSETARGFATEFLKLYQVTPGIDVCIAAPFTELLALEEIKLLSLPTPGLRSMDGENAPLSNSRA